MQNNLMAMYFGQQREDGPDVPLCLTATRGDSSVALNAVGSPSAISLEYSTDTLAWHTYTVGTVIPLPNRGDRVFFKGSNTTFSSSASNYYKFVMTGRIKASGNVMSLIDPTCRSKVIPNQNYFFVYLFANCASLLTAPLLPATTLRNRCYNRMFYNCTSLSATPELPATSLVSYCYQGMFTNCTGLVRASVLPCKTANYSGIYYGMFHGCSSLVESPVIRLVTQGSGVANTLTSMFEGCTSLSKVTVHFADWPYATDWLSGVASEGVFVCPSALDTTTRSASRVPSGWTIQNT